MWAHYTKGASRTAHGHDGFAIEFDEDHPWIKAHAYVRGQPHDSGEVNYEPLRTGWDKLVPDQKFPFVKAESWSYEEEFRLIRFAGTADIDENSLVSFPANLVRSVTLGMYASPQIYEALCRALNSNAGFSNVAVRRVRPHPDKFEFELITLPR